MRRAALLLLLVAGGCRLPWTNEPGELSGVLRSRVSEISALRAELSVTARLVEVERVNLSKTLDAAELDTAEAKALLSLEAPPLERVDGLLGSARSRCVSVRAYLGGT